MRYLIAAVLGLAFVAGAALASKAPVPLGSGGDPQPCSSTGTCPPGTGNGK